MRSDERTLTTTAFFAALTGRFSPSSASPTTELVRFFIAATFLPGDDEAATAAATFLTAGALFFGFATSSSVSLRSLISTSSSEVGNGAGLAFGLAFATAFSFAAGFALAGVGSSEGGRGTALGFGFARGAAAAFFVGFVS